MFEEEKEKINPFYLIGISKKESYYDFSDKYDECEKIWKSLKKGDSQGAKEILSHFKHYVNPLKTNKNKWRLIKNSLDSYLMDYFPLETQDEDIFHYYNNLTLFDKDNSEDLSKEIFFQKPEFPKVFMVTKKIKELEEHEESRRDAVQAEKIKKTKEIDFFGDLLMNILKIGKKEIDQQVLLKLSKLLKDATK